MPTDPAHQLTVRRVIAAPTAKLFEAWTTPAQLRQWWGPRGVRCIHAEVELRVGGEYRLGHAFDDGRVLWITGTFEEITPPERLVYSWQVGTEPASRVTVSFAALDATRTEVTVIHDRIHAAHVRDDHELGWLGCLDGLERWVA